MNVEYNNSDMLNEGIDVSIDEARDAMEVNVEEDEYAAMARLGRIAARMQELEELQRRLTELKNPAKKNHKPGKPAAGRKYVLLTNKLADWGKVPQQQRDLAAILAGAMKVGQEYSEAEVFDAVIDGAGDYQSIGNAVQDPTYLFRYYRGLKNDGKHAGFIARNFIRQVG